MVVVAAALFPALVGSFVHSRCVTLDTQSTKRRCVRYFLRSNNAQAQRYEGRESSGRFHARSGVDRDACGGKVARCLRIGEWLRRLAPLCFGGDFELALVHHDTSVRQVLKMPEAVVRGE